MFGFFFDKAHGDTVTIYEKDGETGIVTDTFDRFEIPAVEFNTAKLRLNNDGSVCAFELWDDEPEKYSCVCTWYRLYFPDGDYIESFM